MLSSDAYAEQGTLSALKVIAWQWQEELLALNTSGCDPLCSHFPNTSFFTSSERSTMNVALCVVPPCCYLRFVDVWILHDVISSVFKWWLFIYWYTIHIPSQGGRETFVIMIIYSSIIGVHAHNIRCLHVQ